MSIALNLNDIDKFAVTITNGMNTIRGKVLELGLPKLEVGCVPIYSMKFTLGGSMIVNDPCFVKRILRSGNRTIVFWQDGTKTIVKRSADTPDDDYSAFTAALAIKMYGSNSALKRMIRKKTELQKKKEKKHEKVTD